MKELKDADSLLTVLRNFTTKQNIYLERFMMKYGYTNLNQKIDEDQLREFVIENGMVIKLAGIEPFSVVNGPGLRYTIFTQGCIHNCKGCHNPQTHNYEDGILVSIQDLYEEIVSRNGYIKGITLSGGDPLYEKNYLGIFKLCKMIKNNHDLKLDIWLYTGYIWESIKSLEIMRYLDVVVDGRFIEELKSFDLKFKGSSNQRIIDVQKSILRNEIVNVNVLR